MQRYKTMLWCKKILNGKTQNGPHTLDSMCKTIYVSDTQLATWKPFLNSYVEKENFHYCMCFFLNIYLVISIYLAVSHLRCSTWDLQSLWQHAVSFICGVQALVPWPGLKPGPPDSGACSLSHWTTREVLHILFLFDQFDQRCVRFWT